MLEILGDTSTEGLWTRTAAQIRKMATEDKWMVSDKDFH